MKIPSGKFSSTKKVPGKNKKKESYIENVHHWQQWSHLHC